MLKGSFDRRVRIDLHAPLPVPTPLPHPPHPLPHHLPLFPHLPHKNHPPTTLLNPTPNPSPRDTNRNWHPLCENSPGKNYPLVSARRYWSGFGPFRACGRGQGGAHFCICFCSSVDSSDERIRAMAIELSLARVIAVIRISSVCWP